MSGSEATPWFERAIRAHEAKHGPCGDAWNISSILNCLWTAEALDRLAALSEEVDGYRPSPDRIPKGGNP